MPRAELPDSARCVIVGGGVGGTSLAYHLAELGWDDVVLVDRNQLTSGSTFHSAGLVGQLRGSVSLTKMMMHSVDLYRRIGQESDFDPGWTECGGIRLASTEERMEELRRQAGWAKTFRLPLELISDFREARWGVVQQAISDLDFDFGKYATKHFDRLLAAIEDPGFEAQLEDASAAR